MFVGVMSLELEIPGALSLKDKRRVVRSVKDSCHRHHMVSVAEVGAHDVLNRAVLGFACVSQSGAVAGTTLDRVLERVRSYHESEVIAHTREIREADTPALSDAPDLSGLSEELLAYSEDLS